MTPIVLNIGWWCYKPREYDKGDLGSISVVYTVLHYTLRFRYVSCSLT